MSFDQDAGCRDFAVVDAIKSRGLFPILEEVCRRRAVTPIEVCGRRRTKNVVKARHEVWWRLRNRYGSSFSYPELGLLFDRDHTTVMAGVRSFAEDNPAIDFDSCDAAPESGTFSTCSVGEDAEDGGTMHRLRVASDVQQPAA